MDLPLATQLKRKNHPDEVIYVFLTLTGRRKASKQLTPKRINTL